MDLTEMSQGSIQCQLLWCERSHMRNCSDCKGWGSMFQRGGKAQRGETVVYSARVQKKSHRDGMGWDGCSW